MIFQIGELPSSKISNFLEFSKTFPNILHNIVKEFKMAHYAGIEAYQTLDYFPHHKYRYLNFDKQLNTAFSNFEILWGFDNIISLSNQDHKALPLILDWFGCQKNSLSSTYRKWY